MPKITKGLTAVLPDLHVPYHDEEALGRALARIREERPERVVILGDLADFEAISKFSRKLKKRAVFEYEIGEVRRVIQELEKEFKQQNVIYICGNHESRLSKYIIRNCPELDDLPMLAFREIVQIPRRWVVYEYNLNAVCIDGVNYIHGRKFSGNVCINNIKKYLGSVVQGHSHRASSQYMRLPNGETIGAVEAGCLCDLQPSYASDVNWSHAMAWAEGGIPYLELL
jgi:predicted phosphodiesterase